MTRAQSQGGRPSVPETGDRPAALLAEMTLEEKLAQIVGLWVGAGADGDVVAPLQDAMLGENAPELEGFAAHGLGHITRTFGTRQVEPVFGARALLQAQRWLVDEGRVQLTGDAHTVGVGDPRWAATRVVRRTADGW